MLANQRLFLCKWLQQIRFRCAGAFSDMSYPGNLPSKLAEDNAELQLDKDRLLGVVRRHKEAGRADSVAAHRDRIRKRNMSEKEVRLYSLSLSALRFILGCSAFCEYRCRFFCCDA